MLIFGLLASNAGHAKSLRHAAVPIGGPHSWETRKDYPSRALREQIGGTTSFRLTVGIDGSVSDCEITVSSGHTILDQATCYFARTRARFTPARDRNGKAIIGTYEYYRQWIPWPPNFEH
jgi:protein TonB